MINICWEKIERYFNEKFSDEDEQYTIKVFEDSEKKDILKSFISRQWKEFQRKTDLPEKNLDHILHKIHYSINVQNDINAKSLLRRFGRWYYRVAAILLIPLMIAGGIATYNYFHPYSGNSETGYAEIHSTLGSRVSFNLPDGSRGWLNSGSTLKYSMNFRDNRLVELEGEAYFDVVKSKVQPFYVKTSDIQIKVLGTRFNVKSYPDDKVVEATLISGLVEIETLSVDEKERRKLTLMPNQKATFRKSSGQLSTQKNQTPSLSSQGVKEIGIYENIDPVPITSWKDSKLIFVNEPFESLLVKLERWYDVKITVRDSALMKLNYTGRFENETVEQAFNAIKVATPNIDYKMNKNKIEIFLKKEKY